MIWTKHALKRLKQRGIKQGDAEAVFRRPDHSRYSKSRGGWVYTRTWGSQQIEVVAKQNERGEWLIISVWSKSITPTATKQSLLHRLFRLFT